MVETETNSVFYSYDMGIFCGHDPVLFRYVKSPLHPFRETSALTQSEFLFSECYLVEAQEQRKLALVFSPYSRCKQTQPYLSVPHTTICILPISCATTASLEFTHPEATAARQAKGILRKRRKRKKALE